MAALVAVQDASKLGGDKTKRLSARSLRPLKALKKSIAESAGFSMPSLTSDAVAAITALATSIPASLPVKETPSNLVAKFNMEEMREYLKDNPKIAAIPEEPEQEEEGKLISEKQPEPEQKKPVSKKTKTKKAKKKKASKAKAEQTPEPKKQEEIERVNTYFEANAEELRSRVISDALITMKVSDQRKGIPKSERITSVIIPEGYRNWLEEHTPMLRKSGRPAGYYDWMDDADAEFKVVEVEQAVYDYVGNLRLDYTRRILPELRLVPVEYDESLKLVAISRMMRSKWAAHGTSFEGPIFPPEIREQRAANKDVPWNNVADESPIHVEPYEFEIQQKGAEKEKENLVSFYKGRVLWELDLQESVEGQRLMQQDSLRAELWLKLDRLFRGPSFSDFTTKHVHVDNVLRKTTETVHQCDETVEPTEQYTPSPCEQGSIKERRESWRSRGKPKYQRYRSPSGKQLYDDGLVKVHALDRAQQVESYLASKTCMRAWHFEKIAHLQDARYLLSQRILEKKCSVPKGKQAILAEKHRWNKYWMNVRSTSSLLVMEMVRPSVTRNDLAKDVVHTSLASQTQKRILKEKQMAEVENVTRKFEARKRTKTEESFKKTTPQKDPYLLGVVADRKDPANDKVERAASKINPASLVEQALIDRSDTLFNRVLSESIPEERLKVSEKMNNLLKGKVVNFREIQALVKGSFKPNDSGILVPT